MAPAIGLALIDTANNNYFVYLVHLHFTPSIPNDAIYLLPIARSNRGKRFVASSFETLLLQHFTVVVQFRPRTSFLVGQNVKTMHDAKEPAENERYTKYRWKMTGIDRFRPFEGKRKRHDESMFAILSIIRYLFNIYLSKMYQRFWGFNSPTGFHVTTFFRHINFIK